MATPLSPERDAEIDNAIAASEDIARTGTTERRCLRCGGPLVMDRRGTSYAIRCANEQRNLITVRG
jgi:hypothetical protein